jgi:ATP-dependent RNA helicase DeaD
MICRRGKVTKVDIGAIRITDNETRFEIANAAVERFTLASIVADDEDVKIERVSGGAGVVHASRNPDRKPNFKPKPEGEVRYEDRKPFVDPDKPKLEGYKGKKPFGDKPKYEGGKPKFEGAGKPRSEGFKPKYEGAPKPAGEGGKPAFKEKKSAWKKRK